MFPPGKIFYSWNERIRRRNDKGISVRKIRDCLMFNHIVEERLFIDSEGSPCYLKIWGNNGKICANILKPVLSHGAYHYTSIVDLFDNFLIKYGFYLVI